MSTVKIPPTADTAIDELADVGALITAKKWHKAAIVAALVGPAPGRGYESVARTGDCLTVQALAGKGIVGLTTHATVERYRDLWCRQRPAPQLGETVDLDGLPEWPGTTDGWDASHRTVVEHKIRTNPDMAERAADVLASTPEGRDVVTRALIRHGAGDTASTHRGHAKRPRKGHTITDAEVVKHGRYILAAVMAMDDGSYQPGPQAALVLAALRPLTDWDAELTALGRQ